jgi:MFS transporter, NNP family, nitrate/nitrite transporter
VLPRCAAGFFSDIAAKRFGMRGRLWMLWFLQTLGGITCIFLALCKDSLAGTVVMLLVFSVFVQAACGATFGVVPFVSKRSLGVVSGMVGAGGSAGAVITQQIFFKDKYSTPTGAPSLPSPLPPGCQLGQAAR